MIHFNKVLSISTAALAMLAASPANASSIGVNFGPDPAGAIDGQTAGAEVTQSVWNDRLGGGSGAAAVMDDSGTLLATTVSVQTQWNATTGAGTSDGDHTLMNGNIDNNGGPQGATVGDIPYAAYDVYIYHEGGNNNGRGGEFQVLDTDNGDALLATQNSYDTFTFDGTYVLANGLGIGTTGLDEDGNVIGSNYIKFTGLTAPNIKIQSTADAVGGDTVKRAPIAAFQIVEQGGGAAPFAITEIEYAPDAAPSPTVTLTWRSQSGKTYSAFSSVDLSGWGNELADSLGSDQDEDPNDGDHITVTFPLTDGLENEDDLFFRIEED